MLHGVQLGLSHMNLQLSLFSILWSQLDLYSQFHLVFNRSYPMYLIKGFLLWLFLQYLWLLYSLLLIHTSGCLEQDVSYFFWTYKIYSNDKIHIHFIKDLMHAGIFQCHSIIRASQDCFFVVAEAPCSFCNETKDPCMLLQYTYI